MKRTTTAAILALSGVLLAVSTATPAPAANTTSEIRERCLGTNPNAPLILEVFSDYQCPACRQFYLEIMRPVLAEYAQTGKACVIYYEFPLPIHKHAREAARYAHAAYRLGQDKWVQVSDALFYYQGQWANDGQLEAVVAKALSPEEMKQLGQRLNDAKLDAAIEQDVAEGRRRNIRATPTLFVTANGRTEQVPRGLQYPFLRRYLDALLAQQ